MQKPHPSNGVLAVAGERDTLRHVTHFHGQTLSRLGLTDGIDNATLDRLQQRAIDIGVDLPESFVEWFARVDGIALLHRHSNCDEPIAIDALGAPVHLGGIAERSWPKAPVLPFMIENQGVCVWGIRLDQGSDPSVVVAVDPDFEWRPQSDRFSTFVACQVRDFRDVFGDDRVVLCAQDVPLDERFLARLRVLCEEGRRTDGWPGDEQYRFTMGDVELLIWNSAYQADWWIASSSAASLEHAARILSRDGTLPDGLYGSDQRANDVLARIAEIFR